MKKQLEIFLSLVLTACAAPLPDQPDGWSCSFFYDNINPSESSFLCNRIRNPSEAKEFKISDPFIQGAKAMDLESFRAYSNYVFQIRKELIECQNQN